MDKSFSFVSVVRGHHVYKSVWTALLEERLSVRPEPGNNHDKHAVSVVKHGEIVGMVTSRRPLTSPAITDRVALSFAWRPGVRHMRLITGGLDVSKVCA